MEISAADDRNTTLEAGQPSNLFEIRLEAFAAAVQGWAVMVDRVPRQISK